MGHPLRRVHEIPILEGRTAEHGFSLLRRAYGPILFGVVQKLESIDHRIVVYASEGKPMIPLVASGEARRYGWPSSISIRTIAATLLQEVPVVKLPQSLRFNRLDVTSGTRNGVQTNFLTLYPDARSREIIGDQRAVILNCLEGICPKPEGEEYEWSDLHANLTLGEIPPSIPPNEVEGIEARAQRLLALPLRMQMTSVELSVPPPQ
jgi:hypothetical protein